MKRIRLTLLAILVLAFFILGSSVAPILATPTPLPSYTPMPPATQGLAGTAFRKAIDARFRNLWNYLQSGGDGGTVSTRPVGWANSSAGVLYATAAPYFAIGDGSADDTAALQGPINSVCAMSGSYKPEVNYPATPGTACYKITSPILANCANLRLNGAGWTATKICQNYFGPTIIAQAAETRWKPPLASSITATWQAGHFYGQYKEIRDSNGNVEVAKTGGTSGSGLHPTWPTTNGGTVSDGGVTWTRAMTGTSLGTGSGSALDAVSPEFFPGAGYGSNNATVEIANAGNLQSTLNGQNQFTIEFYVNVIAPTNSGNQFGLVGWRASAPQGSNVNAFTVYLLDGNSSCTHNCLVASVDIGGSNISLNPRSTGSSMIPGTIHHIAITYDGSNARLFLDGALLKATAASGSWTIPQFESFNLADQGAQCYLCGQYGFNAAIKTLPAYYDSLRISNNARYTSAFTPPTAKLVADGNTRFLLNFSTKAPTGTIEGWNQAYKKNVFIPVETSNGAKEDNPIYIGNMQLSDNGIWATWMINSTIENINVPGAGRTCLNLANNDYQDAIGRFECGVVPSGNVTSVGYLFANQSNNNLYSHLQCDGQTACIIIEGGSGHMILPDASDRDQFVYPFIFYQTFGVTVDTPTTDIEGSAAPLLGEMYLQGNVGPIVVNGGYLLTGSSRAASEVTVKGGTAPMFNGTLISGSLPTQILDVLSNPTTPMVMNDVKFQYAPSTWTNAGKSNYLLVRVGGRDVNGMKFADLGTCDSSAQGTSRWVTDADPAANPPTKCTSVGIKRGAWAHCNNTGAWICTP